MLYVYLVILLTASILPTALAGPLEDAACNPCNLFNEYVDVSGAARTPRIPQFGSSGYNHPDTVIGQRLPDWPTTNAITRPSSGTVSVKRLQHSPPKAARKAFVESLRKTEKGDSIAAIALLQKAIQIDPEYVEAINNLAARYIFMNQFDRAIPHLERAIALDPHCVAPYANLSLALLGSNDAAGAERAARIAVRNDPSDVRSKYLLGVSLLAQKKLTRETLHSLRQAQDTFPRAQLALALAEAASGETAQARVTVTRYLKSKHAELKDQAQSLLDRIDQETEIASK